MKHYDDFSDDEERFAKKDRRKPKGRRSVAQLQTTQDSFDEPGLQALFERGYLDELIGELKSGKEATVYLARGPQGLVAAKVYRDAAVRSFQNDHIYLEGRFISDARLKKALEQRSKTGLSAQQAMWVMHEYVQLWALYGAGIPAPKPLTGPDLDDLARAGRVVLMDFIGDEAGAAPRLADVRLPPEEAEAAFMQSVDLLVALLRLGKVHGDFSAYNLLWWRGQVVIIDVPQMIEVDESPHADTLLKRDVDSLCTSFRGVRRDPEAVLKEVRRRASLPIGVGV